MEHHRNNCLSLAIVRHAASPVKFTNPRYVKESAVAGKYEVSYTAFSFSYTQESPYGGQGSAIFFSSSDVNTQLWIESSYFLNCISDKQGGAINCITKGSTLINNCCASDCSIVNDSTQGSFCYILGKSKLSKFSMSSCSHCGIVENGLGTVYISFGEIEIKSANISKSNSKMSCGFYLDTPSNIGNVTFSTVEKNNCSGDYCIILHVAISSFDLVSCNIIDNLNVAGKIVMDISSTVYMLNCSIINSVAVTLVRYEIGGGSLKLENCYVSPIIKVPVVTIWDQVLIKNTKLLSHLSFAKWDTPLPKMKCVETYGDFQCDPKLYFFIMSPLFGFFASEE